MISHEELLEKNLVALAKTQPRLAGELRKHFDEILGGKLPQPLLKETSSGHWVKGLGESPFFQKDENFDFKRAKAPVYLLFGLGYPPYLFRILRALPQEALAVLVVEPTLEALLFTLSRTSVFQALPQGCRICFLVEDRHALLDEALLWTLVPMG
ncbi:MAG TPA: DUF115 domain-containing protein, partial [Synergistaceae bacterium]|nr:DUF115 domain-containing protein [Synergistaceae bacterium]